MAQSLDRFAERVKGARQWLGPAVKLAVLPEYHLTSYPQQEGIAEWADKAALDPGGPEYERYGRIAQDNGLFLAGNAYETDRHFPGLYFHAASWLPPMAT